MIQCRRPDRSDMTVIRKGAESDSAAILATINDAAHAYRGVIPVDRWHEPDMSTDELEREIADGVVFWVAEQDGRVSGVMGIQDKGEVARCVRRWYADDSRNVSHIPRAVWESMTSEQREVMRFPLGGQ